MFGRCAVDGGRIQGDRLRAGGFVIDGEEFFDCGGGFAGIKFDVARDREVEDVGLCVVGDAFVVFRKACFLRADAVIGVLGGVGCVLPKAQRRGNIFSWSVFAVELQRS